MINRTAHKFGRGLCSAEDGSQQNLPPVGRRSWTVGEPRNSCGKTQLCEFD